jgi:hypothetical protein
VFSCSHQSLGNHTSRYSESIHNLTVTRYEKELWLGEQLNYQVAPNVNGGETCNQRCRAITQIGVKISIGAHGLPSLNYSEMACARVSVCG